MPTEGVLKKETPKAQETRKKILQTAMDLFIERGFAQTTMREIAHSAGLALGAAYYYFSSKEAIVMEFYVESQEEVAQKVREACKDLPDLKGRLHMTLKTQFDYFKPYRKFFGVLSRIAAEPSHPLSPFSKETESIREKSIQVFKEVLDQSKIKIPSDLLPHLPRLLWLYHMGIIFFWLHDELPGQIKTEVLLEQSLEIFIRLIRISRYPFMGSLRGAVIGLLDKMTFEPRPVEPLILAEPMEKTKAHE